MNKLEIIREILNEKYKCQDQNNLIENNKDDKGKFFSVKYEIVSNRNINYDLYRYDKDAIPFFKDSKDLKKMCDYILFAENDITLFIFVIELKLGEISAKKQLEAAEEFVNFILNTGKRVGKIIENYEVRKVRISDNLIKKRKNSNTEKGFRFDNNNYCDYQFKKFYLKPLLEF